MMPVPPTITGKLDTIKVRLGDMLKTAGQIPETDQTCKVYSVTLCELAKQTLELVGMVEADIKKDKDK